MKSRCQLVAECGSVARTGLAGQAMSTAVTARTPTHASANRRREITVTSPGGPRNGAMPLADSRKLDAPSLPNKKQRSILAGDLVPDLRLCRASATSCGLIRFLPWQRNLVCGNSSELNRFEARFRVAAPHPTSRICETSAARCATGMPRRWCSAAGCDSSPGGRSFGLRASIAVTTGRSSDAGSM